MTSTAVPHPVSFKQHLRTQIVPGEAVYLVSESRVSVLGGALATELAPLLDGTRNREQLRRALPGVQPERIDTAVDQLLASGVATDRDRSADRAPAGWLDAAGADTPTVLAALQSARIAVHVEGSVNPAPVLDALAALGIDAGEPDVAPTLTVAVTDDYLRPGLAALNRTALATGTPWLLVRPVGTTIWLGPLFVPGSTGCYECLAVRLAANRQSHSYLSQKLGVATLPAPGDVGLPGTPVLAANLMANRVMQFLAGTDTGPAGVRTIDTISGTWTDHQLVRRPQCTDCGDPTLIATQSLRPVSFVSRPKVFTQDGGHRASSPEDMLATYGHQVSPITGVVTALMPAADTPDGLKVYCSGQNLSRSTGNLVALRRGLRSLSAGKGKTDAQARASAIGEAIERYSGVYRGDEAVRTSSLDELGDAGVDPRTVLLYSDRQYEHRAERRADGSVTSLFRVVPEPFDPSVRTQFSPVYSITQGRHRWLPTSCLYFNTPTTERFGFACSNGNAAGTSLEDAVLQGFLELVERDAVALWWYNRVQRPALDLDAFGDPYVATLRAAYARQHREIWALDLTTDLGIPVVGAFSRRIDTDTQDILIAFGAHLDPAIALSRALSEMNQFVAAATPRPDGRGYLGDEPDQVHWWRTATLDNQPYLVPHPVLPASGPQRWQLPRHTDLLDDLQFVRDLVQAKGMELMVLDQTRPDIGLPVVKVIVPGMRHFWARFAPGRLYDIPVELGWLPARTAEADLNPIPVFI